MGAHITRVRMCNASAALRRAVYELSAAVWHILDADDALEGQRQAEGHLVSHIRVGPV